MKYTGESTYRYKGKDIVFKYISSPTLSQRMTIVDDITNGVISDTVGYEPILHDYFVAVALATNLTDIELPSLFSESAAFIESTNIMGILEGIISQNTLHSIIDAADKKIEYKKNQILNSSKLDDLFAALTVVINKYGETFEGLDINDVMTKLESVNELAKMPQDQVVHNILQYEDSKKQNEVESE